eukprot:5966714-Pleurochrysis_carterae.AAC.2
MLLAAACGLADRDAESCEEWRDGCVGCDDRRGVLALEDALGVGCADGRASEEECVDGVAVADVDSRRDNDDADDPCVALC